jgi:hypothetical protein
MEMHFIFTLWHYSHVKEPLVSVIYEVGWISEWVSMGWRKDENSLPGIESSLSASTQKL